MKTFLLPVLIAYFPLTAVIRVSGGVSVDRTADRISVADGFGLIFILLTLVLVALQRKVYLDKIHAAFLPLVVVFLASAVISFEPQRATMEIVVTTFGYLVSIALVNLLMQYEELDILRFFRAYTLSMGFVALLFLLDFFFLRIVNQPLGGLTGTFRNTGQAGSFFLVHFVICLSLILSGVVPRRLLYWGSAGAVAIALVFTFKRAAWLGIALAITFLMLRVLLSHRVSDKRLVLSLVIFLIIAVPLGTYLFVWGMDAVEGMQWRWSNKFDVSVIDSFRTGFLRGNLEATMAAVSHSPLLGVGLGNVQVRFFTHEIHSTYLAIIATSGLVGMIAYGLFMTIFLRSCYVNNKIPSTWDRFLYYIFPMLFGLLISWGYTYHIRKREFWVLVVFVIVSSYLAKRAKASSQDGLGWKGKTCESGR
jgi:O-antigen ligase